MNEQLLIHSSSEVKTREPFGSEKEHSREHLCIEMCWCAVNSKRLVISNNSHVDQANKSLLLVYSHRVY
jgi:hypothetical protein